MRRWFLVVILVFSSQLVSAQETKNTITISIDDQPLEEILDSISAKTNYFFSYSSSIIPAGSRFTTEADEEKLKDFLDRLFVGIDISFSFSGNQIILKRTKTARPRRLSGTSNFSISGWARDAEDGENIPGVNVYLNGTSIGTVTNNNGYFRFQNVPFGTYEVVFSHVSYDKSLYPVIVNDEGGAAVNGTLKLKTNELTGVEISSTRLVKPADWPRTYEVFRSEFFGNSTNANKCEILNPEEIEFYVDDTKQVLFAEALAPLRIRNEALGYMIIYELDHFENYEDGLVYYGKVRFEQLPVLNLKDKKTWKKNRKRSYYGSVRHFLRSLVDGTYYKEGFDIYVSDKIVSVHHPDLARAVIERILTQGASLNWNLSFEEYLYVEYSKEKESDIYLANMAKDIESKTLLSRDNLLFLKRKPDNQRSMMKLKTSYITIDVNGHIKQPLGISTVGYWAWERFAEMLPIDYDPKKDKL